MSITKQSPMVEKTLTSFKGLLGASHSRLLALCSFREVCVDTVDSYNMLACCKNPSLSDVLLLPYSRSRK